jgi:hypothetical protein
MARSWIKGRVDINVVLAFVFGVIFVTTILVLVIKVPDLGDFQRWVFVIVIALAGAGVAAVLPGILDVKIPYLSAGGALAVFVLVLLNKPGVVTTAIKVGLAEKDATPAVAEFLAKVDNKELEAAWSLLDERAKETIAADKKLYRAAYTNGRYALGDVIRRSEPIGGGLLIDPAGHPPGIYKFVSYQTKFSDGCRQEVLSVRADSNNNWHVYGHNISTNYIPCTP